jgi:hypothetical protein
MLLLLQDNGNEIKTSFHVVGKIHILTQYPREIGVYACSQYLTGIETRGRTFLTRVL